MSAEKRGNIQDNNAVTNKTRSNNTPNRLVEQMHLLNHSRVQFDLPQLIYF